MTWIYPNISDIKLELITSIQKMRNLVTHMEDNEQMEYLHFTLTLSAIRIDLTKVQHKINLNTTRDRAFSNYFDSMKKVSIMLSGELWEIEKKILGVNRLNLVQYENWERDYRNNKLKKPLLRLLTNSIKELEKVLDNLINNKGVQ